MRGFAGLAVAAASLLPAVLAADIDPVVIKGAKFFHKNSGEQFFIKGVAYQQGVGAAGATPSKADSPDPLADSTACKRDVPILKEIDTNTIRVYAIDPKADHSECMTLLADAGIYVVADLAAPSMSINRNDPAWTDDLFTRYAQVLDEMQKYPNFFLGLAGNEVSNAQNNTGASAYVKAAVRDMKAYIRTKGYQNIGIGYATNDDEDIRDNMANYFDCGNPDDAVDFYGYNIYSWCGNSNFQKSGYDVRTQAFRNFNVPVFFAEYGCNVPSPRTFTDTPVLYGPMMNDVWSGGIVYMYFQETNNYGLVKVISDTQVQKLPDFNNLKAKITGVNPKGTTLSAYNPAGLKPATCPAVNKAWGASDDPLPPIANPQLCQCMVSSLKCIVDPGVPKSAYGKLFGYACGNGNSSTCVGVQSNPKTAEYGAYSMCNDEEKLSWVLNQYAEFESAKGNGDTACDFGGKAKSVTPSNLSGDCKNLVTQAGSDGSGTVNDKPTDSGASGDNDDAASGLTVPKVAYIISTFAVASGLLYL